MILCSCRYTENKQHQLCVIKVTSTKLNVIISILFRLQYINLKFYNTMEIKEIKISEEEYAQLKQLTDTLKEIDKTIEDL